MTQIAAQPDADFVVETKAQLIAALKAAAQPTFEVAKKHPFTVRWGSTRYTFKEGVSQLRAAEIVTNIERRAPWGVTR